MSVALPRPLLFVLQEDFDALPDPRVERTRLHRLSDLLLLSLGAVCCGAESFEDIQVWCLAHGQEALRARLGVHLDNGIPHHDTFRRVLGRLEPQGLGAGLHLLRQRLPKPEGHPIAPTKHVAIDGKDLRGSQDATKGVDALSLLSLFATDLNLVLGQSKIDSKTNEIPVAREVLKAVAIEGATVTADALHCQKETAEAIRERDAHYLLAVKDNQKGLHEALKSLFTVNKRERHLPLPMSTFRQEETGHGRLEVRHGCLIRVDDWLPEEDPLRVWKDWHSVLCIESQRRWRHRGQQKQSQFTRYFISSSPEGVEAMMGFARSHWKIENSLHWIMDVTFGEDASRVRAGHEAQNLATLRRIAAFLLKATEPESEPGEAPDTPKAIRGMSLRKRKKWAGWKAEYLQKVLTN